jgi:hypothetical protein
MIETGTKHGRGPSGIFRSTEDYDGVGCVQLLLAGFMHNSEAGDQQEKYHEGYDRRDQP